MVELNTSLSADVTYALGWTLIHSLWQCLGLVALAAILTGLSRRPPVRYLISTFVLVAVLLVPIATFVILMEAPVPARTVLHASAGSKSYVVSVFVKPTRAIRMMSEEVPMASREGAAVVPQSPSRPFPVTLLSSKILIQDIFPWLARAWLCGVALFSLRVAADFAFLEYKRPRQTTAPGFRTLAICYDLQRQLGLSRAIKYLECGWLQVPAVIGWIRPVVLLPVWASTGLSETQLRAVIAHELGHIRRFDPFVNLFQVLVETLFFYHPAVWWLNGRIRAERELCCDEIAISVTGNRMEYAKILTLMAKWAIAPTQVMAANRGPLSQRILHALGRSPVGGRRRMLGLTGSILFLVTAIAGANLLFETTYPMVAAHTKATPIRAPSPNSIALNHIVGRVAELPANDVLPAQSSDSEAGLETAAPDRTDFIAKSRLRKLLVRSEAEKIIGIPSPDLSRLLPKQSLLTPVLVTSNNTTTLSAQPPHDNSPATAAAPPKAPTCAPQSVKLSVDLRDVPDSYLRTVPVAINGSRRQFLLDVGTKPTEIAQAAARDLALPDAISSIDSQFLNSPQPVALFDIKGGRSADDYRPYVRIASFAIGGATGNNLEFVVAKDPDLGRSEPYDGLMTGDFFKQDDVELDFAQNELSYLTPTNCTDPDQVAYWPHTAVAMIPMAILDGKILVEVLIQGHAIPAVIDTTSPRTVMRRDIAELMLGLKADAPDMVPEGNVRDGIGLQVYRHTFSQISFVGGVTAENVPVLIQSDSMIRNLNRTPILGSRAQFVADPDQRIPSLTIGMDLLHQLHLYVAYRQQKLYVTSAE